MDGETLSKSIGENIHCCSYLKEQWHNFKIQIEKAEKKLAKRDRGMTGKNQTGAPIKPSVSRVKESKRFERASINTSMYNEMCHFIHSYKFLWLQFTNFTKSII